MRETTLVLADTRGQAIVGGAAEAWNKGDASIVRQYVRRSAGAHEALVRARVNDVGKGGGELSRGVRHIHQQNVEEGAWHRVCWLCHCYTFRVDNDRPGSTGRVQLRSPHSGPQLARAHGRECVMVHDDAASGEVVSHVFKELEDRVWGLVHCDRDDDLTGIIQRLRIASAAGEQDETEKTRNEQQRRLSRRRLTMLIAFILLELISQRGL